METTEEKHFKKAMRFINSKRAKYKYDASRGWEFYKKRYQKNLDKANNMMTGRKVDNIKGTRAEIISKHVKAFAIADLAFARQLKP